MSVTISFWWPKFSNMFLACLDSRCEAFGGTHFSKFYAIEVVNIQRINIYNEDYYYEKIMKIEDRASLNTTLEKKNDYYQIKEIPKKNGKRIIHSISADSPLFYYQENLWKNFLCKIPCSTSAYGFVKGSSYKDFLIPHQRMSFFLRVDIKDFFNSIDKEKIKEVLRPYVKLENDKVEDVLESIAELVTVNSRVPQGAVTSPQISNIVFRQLDIRIQKYCQKLHITYTRYADDLLFSSNSRKLHFPFFLKTIKKILRSQNFLINSSKIIKTENEISLNGFTVGKVIRLSRTRKQDLIKVLFLFNQGGKPKSITELLKRLNVEKYRYRSVQQKIGQVEIYFKNKESLLNYLSGYRALLIDWGNNFENKALKSEDILIKRLEKIIREITVLN